MAALALALATTGEASASADTITVTPGPDPTEEVPVRLSVGWAGAPGQRVLMTSKPGAGGCGATFLGDLGTAGSTRVMSTAGHGATGTAIEEQTFKEPGTQTLCAYLQARYDAASASAVSGPVTLTVRSARATVGIVLPPRVAAGRPYGIDLAVTSELARRVYATIKPAGGRGCEAAYTPI